MKNNLITRALLHSLGVFVYIFLIALFFFNANKIFGQEDNFLMPVAMLLLLIISATITGSLVLGKPILMYLDNQKSDAMKLFYYTIGWLAVITTLILIILAIIK